jgi:hypothetical protein
VLTHRVAGPDAAPPRPPLPDRAGLVAVALAALAHVAVVVAALAGSAGATTALVVLVAVAEVWVARRAPLASWALDRMSLPPAWRWLAVGAAVLVVMARTGAPQRLGTWLLIGMLVLGLGTAGLEGCRWATTYWRKSPLLARNLPLGDLALPASPAALLRRGGSLAWPLQLLLLLATASATADLVPVGVGVAGAVLAALGGIALAGWAGAAAVRARRSRLRQRVPAAVQAAITAWSPDVVLYFGGPATALYQVEMWLPTMERSRHRVMVLVRDREAWRRLRPTTLPVVCAEADTVVTALDLGSVRGALFVANGSTNIHLLRVGGMRTAFIGHGDSDKASSRNPFVKVYDEIWVAGPAGARRYDTPDTRDVLDRIRVVGLPQAASSTPRAPRRPLTVVYAPTWEGWGDEPHHSSLPDDGAAIVEALLSLPDVRLVSRPHPLTGTRDAATRRAHRAVLDRLRAAGATVPRPGAPSGGRSASAGADELDLMRAGSQRTPAAPEDGRAASWDDPAGRVPVAALDDHLPLSVVLDQADLLVSDISGVLSDWIALDRPLAVTNPAGLTPEEFARRFPSSGGGLLLGPRGAGLVELVQAVQRGDDPTAAARAAVRLDLLGPPDSGAARFEAALDELTR